MLISALFVTDDNGDRALVHEGRAESARRALQMVRIYTWPFASMVSEDAPIWSWLDIGWADDFRTLADGEDITVVFDIDHSRLEWNIRHAVDQAAVEEHP